MTIPDYDTECDCDVCQQLRKERNEYYDNLHKERDESIFKSDDNYYLITLNEIGEIIDLTENMSIEDRKSECVKIARKRIDLINKIKKRKYTEKYREECIVQQAPDPKDFCYCEEEPPDYDDCPCWMSPADPEGTTGTCEGDWGDCKLWYWNCDNKSYTECNRFAKDCTKCLEILCKFRTVKDDL